MKNFSFYAPIAVAVIIVFWMFSGGGNQAENLQGDQAVAGVQTGGQNVYEENGKQVVEILARGGYSPARTVAKSGVDTILRVKTQNTFDCSASLVIPSLGYRQFLKQNGTEDIIVPADKAQGTLRGLCSMGMYSFEVSFE